jgi:hypothetical protein
VFHRRRLRRGAQLERGLDAITRLWDGETVTMDGGWFRLSEARPEVYTDDIHDPAEMARVADERMSDEEFAREGFLVGDDAAEHVERLREMRATGPTVVCLQGIGDADPLGSIRRYGDEVLPALRGARGCSGPYHAATSSGRSRP